MVKGKRSEKRHKSKNYIYRWIPKEIYAGLLGSVKKTGSSKKGICIKDAYIRRGKLTGAPRSSEAISSTFILCRFDSGPCHSGACRHSVLQYFINRRNIPSCEFKKQKKIKKGKNTDDQNI